MAVKLPPNTYVNQVVTLKGLRDDVFSRIDGSLVGYVKDGKFIQTIDKLPEIKKKVKKKPVVDKEFSANIKKISALNAIPALEQDAEYYKNEAEDINNTPAERASALSKYKALQADIATKQKEAGEAGKVESGIKQEGKAKDARKRATEIQNEYSKLEEQLSLVLDPTSDKAGQIKNKMNKLVEEFRGVYSTVVNVPISLTAARLSIKGEVPQVPSAQTPTTVGDASKIGPDSSGYVVDSVTGKRANGAYRTKTGGTMYFKDGVTVNADGTPFKPDRNTDGTIAPPPVQTSAPAPKPAPATTPRPSTGTTGGGTTGGTTGNTGQAVPSNFNVGTFRKADEASMAKASGVTPNPTGTKTPLDTLLEKTEFWYDLPDYIFKLDPKLGELLVQAVNTDMDPAIFLSKAKLTPWWQKNSESVRTKIVNREKYNDLLKAGEDVKNTEYGMYLSKQMRAVKAKARELAGVTLTDEQAQSVAQKIYDGNLEDDPLAINALIIPFIGKVTSIVGTGTKQTGFGGEALQNYQTLQGIAKANGFSLKDILPNISAITAGGDLETAVLRGLADGSIDINRVAQDARMLAAQGQPQYVRNLLGQGYDLEAVYAPYRKTMATELELNPDQIDLNDSTLRMAITDKGDMNLYDFKKALRQDNRWQYTGTAKEEVSKAALKVLQDFGFQG
jgi:hypothetical protein